MIMMVVVDPIFLLPRLSFLPILSSVGYTLLLLLLPLHQVHSERGLIMDDLPIHAYNDPEWSGEYLPELEDAAQRGDTPEEVKALLNRRLGVVLLPPPPEKKQQQVEKAPSSETSSRKKSDGTTSQKGSSDSSSSKDKNQQQLCAFYTEQEQQKGLLPQTNVAALKKYLTERVEEKLRYLARLHARELAKLAKLEEAMHGVEQQQLTEMAKLEAMDGVQLKQRYADKVKSYVRGFEFASIVLAQLKNGSIGCSLKSQKVLQHRITLQLYSAIEAYWGVLPQELDFDMGITSDSQGNRLSLQPKESTLHPPERTAASMSLPAWLEPKRIAALLPHYDQAFPLLRDDGGGSSVKLAVSTKMLEVLSAGGDFAQQPYFSFALASDSLQAALASAASGGQHLGEKALAEVDSLLVMHQGILATLLLTHHHSTTGTSGSEDQLRHSFHQSFSSFSIFLAEVRRLRSSRRLVVTLNGMELPFGVLPDEWMKVIPPVIAVSIDLLLAPFDRAVQLSDSGAVLHIQARGVLDNAADFVQPSAYFKSVVDRLQRRAQLAREEDSTKRDVVARIGVDLVETQVRFLAYTLLRLHHAGLLMEHESSQTRLDKLHAKLNRLRELSKDPKLFVYLDGALIHNTYVPSEEKDARKFYNREGALPMEWEPIGALYPSEFLALPNPAFNNTVVLSGSELKLSTTALETWAVVPVVEKQSPQELEPARPRRQLLQKKLFHGSASFHAAAAKLRERGERFSAEKGGWLDVRDYVVEVAEELVDAQLALLIREYRKHKNSINLLCQDEFFQAYAKRKKMAELRDQLVVSVDGVPIPLGTNSA